MNKKNFFWVLSFIIIQSAFGSFSHNTADSCLCKSHLESLSGNKWRIGGGIGIDYLNIEAKIKDNYPFGGYLLNEREQTRKHFQVSPSIEIGKIYFNDFYFGVLASWHFLNVEKKSKAPLRNATYFQHNLKISYCFDVLAKIGYKIDPKKMAYILIGPSFMQWSHITKQHTYNYRLNREIEDARFKIRDKTQGLAIGLGVEHVIYDRFILSMNYKMSMYKTKLGKKTMTYRDPRTRPIKLYTGIAEKKIKLSSDSLMISFSYFF